MGATRPTKAHHSVGLAICTRDGRMSKGGRAHGNHQANQSAPFRWPGRLYPRWTHDRCRHMGATRPTKARRSVGLAVCTRDGRMSKGGQAHGSREANPSAPFRWAGRLYPRWTHDWCWRAHGNREADQGAPLDWPLVPAMDACPRGGRHMGAARPTKPQGSTAQISPQGVTRLTTVCQGAQEAAREAASPTQARRSSVGLAVCTATDA